MQYKVCRNVCTRGFAKCAGAKIGGVAVSSYASPDDFCTGTLFADDALIEIIVASGQCFDAGNSLLANLALTLTALVALYYAF